MGTGTLPWICCQLGAREHYAIPRALHRRGALRTLVTEAWVRPGNWLGHARRGLRERFHAELGAVDVRAFNVGSVAFELRAKLAKKSGWPLIVERNRWFQEKAVEKLKTEEERGTFNIQHSTFNAQPTVFAYSYAGLEIFRWAKSQGWRTVLGQIDPGLPEERLVAKLHEADPVQAQGWQRAPAEYWADWREECEIADCIVVNSDWSRRLLVGEGVAEKKIRVVPLAYAAPSGAAEFHRIVPEKFSTERPLRALFLGQVNLRKGVGPLLDAVRLMRGVPVEFWFVGPEQLTVPPDLRNNPQVRWLGAVARGAAADFYRQADVFLFPTLSDGFGLTQLEAQAWQLPVIASRNCGDVVSDDVNGVLLNEVSGVAIAGVLKELVNDPERVRRLSAGSCVDSKFSLDALATALVELP